MDEKIPTMRELPISERPYEKCETYGAGILSDGELLAVILRTGSRGLRVTDLAGKLLAAVPGKNLAGLCRMTYEDLMAIRGIGRVKALQIICLSELVKRIQRTSIPLESLVCDEPNRIAAHFMASMRHLETEQVRLLVLNAKNAIIKEMVISDGSFNAAVACPREIFYYALKYRAVSIIVLHNHPSGDPTPSKQDMVMTRRIADTGNMIGLPLLDHIIIGDNRYVSFKESGFLS